MKFPKLKLNVSKYLDLNDFVVTGRPQTLVFYEKKPQVCCAGPDPGQSDMESNNNIVSSSVSTSVLQTAPALTVR